MDNVPILSNPENPPNPSPSQLPTNTNPEDVLSIPLPDSPKPISSNVPISPFQTPHGSLQYLSDIGEDLCLSIGTHPTNVFQPTPLTAVPFNIPLPVPPAFSQTDQLISGIKNTRMETDLQSGISTLRDPATLVPYNPSSPPRKKAKGGKRKLLDTEKKFVLNLDADNWARYYVIKKKEGSFKNDCSFKMAKFFKNVLGKTKSVKKLGDGSLCIEAETKAQAEMIKALTKLQDAEVEAGPHKRLNTSQGVITCSDFLNSTIEDIREGLAEEGVVEVRRIKRRQGDMLVDTASLVLTFDRPKPPAMIEAAFYKLKVRPYIPSPLRCFRCQKFGHTSQRCRSADQVCVCGKVAHEGECTPPVICINCGGEHNAKSSDCPVLKEEKEIQKLKTLQQLPYQEARAIVKSKSYAKPDSSYAEKARSKEAEFEFKAAPTYTMGQTKVASSPGLREKIIKVGDIPPPTFSAPKKGAPVGNLNIRLPPNPSSSSGGSTGVGGALPQFVAPPDGAWQVVRPPRRSLRRSDPNILPPNLQRSGSTKKQSTSGDSRISSKQQIRRSPRPKWVVAGTDLEASESDGGGPSDRPSTSRKKATRGRQRKIVST